MKNIKSPSIIVLTLILTIFLTAFVSLLLPAKAEALPNTNPQMRECRLSGGSFFTVDFPNDQVGVCQLDGSIIGALDLMYARTMGTQKRSVMEYLNSPTVCTGALLQITNTEGRLLPTCLYLDGSMLDVESLTAGKNSYRNSKLNSALRLN